MDITLTSTTESQEDVNRVMGIVPEVADDTKEEVSETPTADEQETDQQEEVETAPTTDTGHAEKKNGKGRFSKRIDELVRERYEARQEAETLRKKLEQIEKGVKPAETQPDSQPSDGKPIRSSFTSDEEWVEALASYKAQQALAQWQTNEAQRKRQERDSQVVASYQQRVEEFSQEHPDFNEVADISLAAEIGPAVEAAIKGRQNGPEIAYFLGQNPEVQDELNSMNPVEAVAEIGAISAALMPKKSSPKPPVTVPAPLTPVGGSTRVAQSMADLDTDAWIAERKRQKAAQAAARR